MDVDKHNWRYLYEVKKFISVSYENPEWQRSVERYYFYFFNSIKLYLK